MENIEVLSPVGSMDSLTAAVRCGADAIYLGAADFSARRKAKNFTKEELLEAVKYCHKHNVKVYVTVNIMLKQKELKDALTLVDYLYHINVDGLIVQDLGLAYLIHKFYPDFPLHGSTQMSIHQKDALSFLKKYGFSRIVVSREMSKEQLKEFCLEAKKENIEVEHFVHGALCMSVSGQCLLSAMLGSRSGNRGLCAQPCRLPFKVRNGTGHDLSLKDCSLFEYVDQLREMGICSLKIEGRMKREEYVAIATYCCRSVVDGKKIDDDNLKMLKDVFSRSGFTDGYYTHHLGKEMFGTRTEEDLQASTNAFNKIHQLYRHEMPKIPIDFSFKVIKNQGLYLTAYDGKNEIVINNQEITESNSQNRNNEEDIRRSLEKLGNTGYFLRNFDYKSDDSYFIPCSIVNKMRRQAIEKLDELRQTIIEKPDIFAEIENRNKEHSLKKTYIRIATKEQIPDNTDMINGIIIPIEMEMFKTDVEIIIEIPRWISDETFIYNRMEYFKNNHIQKVYCNNISAIVIAKKFGMEIIGGNYLNIANGCGCNLLQDYGINEITLSSELSLKEISEIPTSSDKGIIAYGYLPLMLLINCPLKNGRKCSQCDQKGYIVDRMNIKFPIRCHRRQYSELLNSTPIYLADKKDDYRNIDYQILYFTIEDAQTVKKIIEAYNSEINTNEQFTRGLYYRSVK